MHKRLSAHVRVPELDSPLWGRIAWSSAIGFLLAGALFATAVPGRAQDNAKPPPLADGVEPFLSGCVERSGPPSWSGAGRWIERPSKARPSSIFYDVPFALNVPVKVTFQGGVVRVTCCLTVQWDDPPKFWNVPRSLGVFDGGLHRLDGGQLAGDSVFHDRSGFETDSKQWKKLILDAGGPVPTWTFPWGGNEPRSSRFLFSPVSEHLPFQGGSRNSFVLAPAQPGNYALWFALDCADLWPDNEPLRGEIRARFHVDVLVSRGERPPRESEIAYLFGRDKRPAGMPDDKLFLASTQEIPVTLRADGWSFHHAEAIPTRNSAKQPHLFFATGISQTNTETTSSASVGGTKVQLKLKATSWDGTIGGLAYTSRTRPAAVKYWEDNSWTLDFPAEIPDRSFGTLTVSGGKQRWYNFANNYYHLTNWVEVDRLADGSVYKVAWMPEWFRAPDTNFHSSLSEVWRTLAEGDRNYRASDRTRFFREYGPDAARWFFDDYRPRLDLGPADGGEPFRFLLRGYPPQEHDRQLIIGGDGKPSPAVAYNVGNWLVVGYYQRIGCAEKRSEGSTPSPSTGTITQEADPFWKWYPELSSLIRDRLKKVAMAKSDAGLEALPLQELLKSVARLNADLVPDELPPDASRVQRAVRAVENVAASGTSAPLTTAAMQRKIQLLKERTAEIRERRESIERLTAEAQAALADILAKLDEGFEKFSDRHPQVLLWKKPYREMRERIPYDIALISKDRELVRRALQDAETRSASAATRVLEAQLHMSEGDPVAALDALRSAARIDPEDTVARQALADLECAFLKTAIDKSQGAIAQARAAFYGYLLERGFSAEDISVTGDTAIERIVSWSISAVKVYGEEAWAVFTTGLFGSFSAFYGKPAAEADLLATTERQMTTAFIGLNTMLRLRARGFTFDQIQKMTSAQMREAVPWRDVNGNPFSEAQARLHVVAMREAMKLPDAQALMADDQIGLRLGLQENYWNNKDVGDTWIEFIGDATSVFNLLTMLPAAKVGMAGRAGIFWTEADLAMMRDLEKMGKVISGTEAVANAVGITKVLGAAGSTAAGQRFLAWSKRAAQYQRNLKWYDQVIWTSGKLVGMVTIQTTTVLATEKLAGHKAAMLMGAALMFGSDSELLLKLLNSKGIPPQKISALIVNDFLPAAQTHLEHLNALEKTGVELRALLDSAKAGKTLSPFENAFLERHFGKEWRQRIPTGEAGHDAALALEAGADGVRTGSDNGAVAAFDEFKPAVQEEIKDTAAAADQAQKLATDLDANAQARPPPPRSTVPPTLPPDLDRKMPTKVFGAAEASRPGKAQYRLPPAPRPNSRCAKAEALMHAGKYKEAQAEYEDLIDKIIRGEIVEADELPLEQIHLKRCLAYELQGASRKIPLPNPASVAVNQPILASEVEAALAKRSNWQPISSEGVMSDVFKVPGMDDYIVKVVSAKKVPPILDVEGNIVHADLAHALGLDTPGMNVRLVFDAKGQVQEAIYLIRKVDGGDLVKKSSAEIFLYREELSRHRALAVLLCDYDRKLDNYMVASDGRLFAIDAGMSDVGGTRHPQIDSPLIMEGEWGRDHWLSRIAGSGGDPENPLAYLTSPDRWRFRRNLVAEEALTWEAARPTAEAIEALVKDEARLRGILEGSYKKIYATEAEGARRLRQMIEKERGLGAVVTDPAQLQQYRERVVEDVTKLIQNKVDRTVTVLQTRAKRLQEVLKGLNQRNALPLDAVFYWHHQMLDDSAGNLVLLAELGHTELALAA